MKNTSKVMIVDDNPANLKLAGDLLELEGYEVIRCIDAEQAQQALLQNHPVLILMDVALPGMDGLELTQLLKADEKTKDIKIVALTAFAMKSDKEKALSAGCDGYITKPINTRQFIHQINEYLNPEEKNNTTSIILLVDDNPTSLKLLKAVYETEGYETLSAGNGLEALEVLSKHKANLIVTDVLMPEMDGYYLCYKIRSNEELKNIPIIVYTATYTSLSEESVAKEMGADLFIRKPAPIHLLISSAKEILGNPVKAARPIVSAPKSSEVMHQYSSELISKLEKRSVELEEAKESLELTLRRFSQAQKISRLGHSVIDLKTGEHIWSEEMFRILGLEPYSIEPYTENFLKYVHPDDLEKFTATLDQSNKLFSPYSTTCRLLQANGTLRHLLVRREYEFDKAGAPIRAYATVLDITELMEKEEKLKQTNEELELTLKRFSQAEQIAHLGHGESDLNTGRVIWSEEMFRIYGLEPNSLEPSTENFLKCIHPDDREKVLAVIINSRQTLSSYSLNCRVLQPNGNLRHLFFKGGYEFDKAGKPIRVYGTTMDVTELVEKEEKLKEVNEELELTLKRFSQAQQIAHLGHWELDLNTGKILWSEETFRILGFKPYSIEASLERFLECIHPDEREKVSEIIHQSLLLVEPYKINHRLLWPNGELRHLFIKGEYEFDKSGKPIRVYGTMLDVTELMEKEEKLKEVNEELELFIYKSSHDLKGPIATLLGLVSLAKISFTDETILQYVNKIDIITHKLKTTISQLLEIMHLRRVKPLPVVIDIEETIKEVLGSLKYMEEYEQVRVTITNKQKESIKADKGLVVTILSNLLENSIRYKKDNGKNSEINITISTENESKNTLIEIEDNGIGILEKEKGKIFNMFYRASEKSHGAGLGLYLVKNAIEKANGTIDFTSQQGIGSTFKVTLPLEL